MSIQELCPCGSQESFTNCCKPILGGKAAPTAESLMRSRYSAYVKGNIQYLIDSVHPKYNSEVDANALQVWSEKSQWLGLKILKTQKGKEADTEGTVEFIATYKQKEETIEHHEVGFFKKEKGKWWFCEGKTPSIPTIRHTTPKVGRNDVCPCGSGKKHKKCCM